MRPGGHDLGPAGGRIARGGPRRALAMWSLLALAVALPGLTARAIEPVGLVNWGHQTRVLGPGESATFQVTAANLPLRRFTLLVESAGAPCDLNVRRDADGSLLHDVRGEVRHEVDVPWGTDESLTAVLTAGSAGGSYDVSFWGPPAGEHRRAYSYHVNRALEAHDAGDGERVREHCRAALRQDPHDAIAGLMLRRLESGDDPPFVGDTRQRRADAAALQAAGKLYDALAVLDDARAAATDSSDVALVLFDLGALHAQMDNPVQARLSYEAARRLGLPPDLAAAADSALAALPARAP